MIKSVSMLLVCFLSITGCRTVPEATVAEESSRETLGRHETIAEFEGISEYTCRGRTALCPDRCGHSGSVAVFKIIEYIHFDKRSEYGDKQVQFSFLLEDNRGDMKIDPSVYETVFQLEAGDQVLLSWNHDYVTRAGGTGPERPITKLERVSNTDK